MIPFNPRANGADSRLTAVYQTRNGFATSGNTAIPCAVGTCSFAAPNAKSVVAGNVFHVRIGDRRKLSHRQQPMKLGFGGTLSIRPPMRLILSLRIEVVATPTVESITWISSNASNRPVSSPTNLTDLSHAVVTGHCSNDTDSQGDHGRKCVGITSNARSAMIIALHANTEILDLGSRSPGRVAFAPDQRRAVSPPIISDRSDNTNGSKTCLRQPDT